MDRRKLLGTAGSLFVGSIAGCSGGSDSSGDGGGTPTAPSSVEYDEDADERLQIIEIAYPDDVKYGSEFSVQLQYGNVGGDVFEGTAEASLVQLTTADVEPQTIEIEVESLEPGRTGTATAEFEATAAGDYRFEPGDDIYELADDVEPLLTVQPATRSVGEEIEDGNNLRYTLQQLQFEQSLLNVPEDDGSYYDDGSLNLRSTLEDRIIAIFELEVSNAGKNGQTISAETFSVADGTPLSGYNDPVLDDSILFDTQINPGESRSGYLPYVVPKSGVPELSFGINVASESSPADIAVLFDQDSPSYPSFELDSQAVPSQFNDGETRFGFTIENTGGAVGTFRGYIEFMFLEDPGIFSSYDANEWYTLSDSQMTAEIAPGSTRTVEAISTYDGDLKVKYRLKPMDFEYTVEPRDSE